MDATEVVEGRAARFAYHKFSHFLLKKKVRRARRLIRKRGQVLAFDARLRLSPGRAEVRRGLQKSAHGNLEQRLEDRGGPAKISIIRKFIGAFQGFALAPSIANIFQIGIL